jgi:hypothetical protein
MQNVNKEFDETEIGVCFFVGKFEYSNCNGVLSVSKVDRSSSTFSIKVTSAFLSSKDLAENSSFGVGNSSRVDTFEQKSKKKDNIRGNRFD